MSRSLLFLSTLLVCLVPFGNHAHAQFQNRPNGMASAAPRTHALVHATLIPSPGQRVENATIVLRDGGVLSVESSGEVPPGAVVHDLTGHVVAPGFIDPSVLVEAEIGDAAGSHWNRLVHPEFDFTSSASFGFGKAVRAPPGGFHVGGRPAQQRYFSRNGNVARHHRRRRIGHGFVVLGHHARHGL